MSKSRFIVKRLGACLVTLLALSLVVFGLLFLAPGDPARNLVGTKKVTPELLSAIRAQYHLDEPFLSQYFRWIGGVFRLDFGHSIRTNTEIATYIAPHAKVTFQLVGISLLISAGLGVPLGIASAKGKGKGWDKLISLSSLVGTSAPSFAVGLILLYVFAHKLNLFPVYGATGPSALILPAITLSFGVSASIIKITRQAMLGEIKSDYSLFMRARALSPGRITLSQLKNAASPVLTSTGLVLASLFGATVLVESVFSIPGLGNLLNSSVTFHDVPVVQFIALALAVVICLASALVDILVYLISPRMQQAAAASSAKGGAPAGEGPQ